MRAGTEAAIAKVFNRGLSQAWSRHFYETREVYGEVDGLIFRNAHNDEEAVALYEQADNTLDCPPSRINDEALRPTILEAADDDPSLHLAFGDEEHLLPR